MKKDTGLKDDSGNPIKVGYTLECIYGYSVIVKYSKTRGFYGKLICDDGDDSRKNAHYHLNNGKGHTIKNP